MNITGTTRLYAIIGDPILHVRTPATLNPLIREAGIEAILVPFHIPEGSFDEVVPAIGKLANLDGLVVTYPFKERALAIADEPSDRARMVGGVNVLRRGRDGRWTGDMFDGLGLLEPLARQCRIAGARVLLIGAGGAGRAVGLALAEAGAASITVVDLDEARSRFLVDAVRGNFPACRIEQGAANVAGHDIVVNATPVGMKAGDPLPADVTGLSTAMTVADVVLSKELTPLLRAASEAGAKIVQGAEMTRGQARAILTFLAGIAAPE